MRHEASEQSVHASGDDAFNDGDGGTERQKCATSVHMDAVIFDHLEVIQRNFVRLVLDEQVNVRSRVFRRSLDGEGGRGEHGDRGLDAEFERKFHERQVHAEFDCLFRLARHASHHRLVCAAGLDKHRVGARDDGVLNRDNVSSSCGSNIMNDHYGN